MPEERIQNLEGLMNSHVHDGSNSNSIDIFNNDDTQTAIDDNEYMFATATASDNMKIEDATEHALDGDALSETIYTLNCPYNGTIRIKYDGKEEVTNAQVKIEVRDIKTVYVIEYSRSLNLNYVAYSRDIDVKIGYKIYIKLTKQIIPAIGYLKNFEVCYDITKNQGTSFI